MRDPKPSLDRRTMLAGAGTVGALATAAALLPGTESSQVPAKTTDGTAPQNSSAGYRLTEHIKRYYSTTRI